MPSAPSSDEDLWQRVGLQELRRALRRVQELTREFEAALGTLPACHTCARATLVEQINRTAHRLGQHAASVSVLASTLSDAMAATEEARKALISNVPSPCQCAGGPCTCHD